MTKKLLLIVAAMTAMCGCSLKPAHTSQADEGNRTLVLYYSQTGATKSVACELQKQLGCDIAAIEAANPYDGDYTATIGRWRKELSDSVKVALKHLEIDIAKYDTIFLGFPIWGGTYALPMASFLADNSLAGKTIVTFATFGSGGIDNATEDVAKMQNGAKVVRGYGVRNARVDKAPAEIKRFLIDGGYITGKTDPLPDFSEVALVDNDDVAVFNSACGNYQFPLGTPVKVAKRVTKNGMDFKFYVKSQTPDGKEVTSTVFVTADNGSTPEFTEVIRP